MNAPFHRLDDDPPFGLPGGGHAAAPGRGHAPVAWRLALSCPVTASLVLITDDATLESLGRPLGRIRCSACGEMHMLTPRRRLRQTGTGSR